MNICMCVDSSKVPKEQNYFFEIKRRVTFARLNKSLMEQSPSREAANCEATKELPGILWNPTAQYRVNNSPTLVPILSKINPIHSISSYLSEIHFNIVYPPTHVLVFLVVYSLLLFRQISYTYPSSPRSC
jgi:hypothetical protein